MSSIRTLTTRIRRETFLSIIHALGEAGAVYTALDLETRTCTIIFPNGIEMMVLEGPVARTLYRTPNGTVFAWVDAYDGEQEVFQLSSQRAWNLNYARGMRVISQ